MRADVSVSAGRGPLLAAKGRMPPLPVPHLPRPRIVTALLTALRAHRLVVLNAGALTGKTTALSELVQASRTEPEHIRWWWYSVDEVDASPGLVLEGLVRATCGDALPGDETALLGAVIAALDQGATSSALVLDDLHRAPAATVVLDRLLRYLPPRAHILVSTWPGRDGEVLPPLYRWLEDRRQVACLDSALLRLDDDERACFQATTERDGGAWAVEYRPGGQVAVVDGLRRGVLPALAPELRPLISLLAVVPAATSDVLSAALILPVGEIVRRLAVLREQTVLLEESEASEVVHYRLTETARQAALGTLDAAALAAMRRAAAQAIDALDPAHAAQLWARAGCLERACTAARRLSWAEWTQHSAQALEAAALLPDEALRTVPALALVVAHHRLVARGASAAHALVRTIRPHAPIEAIQRLLLLAYCCAARQRPWSLSRCISALEALLAPPTPALEERDHAYGLLALGIARGRAGLHELAAGAVRSSLDVLALSAASDAHAAWIRLTALSALAVAERRQGHLTEAERLYTEAEAQARAVANPHTQLELANNRAVLLQQRGAHTESAALLRTALASPWSAERGLRPLLSASLADALAALNDRSGAAQALAAALDDVQSGDAYGLHGHVRAMRALLWAEAGYRGPAETELAAGAPADHAATLLARALLGDPHSAAIRPALQQALAAAGADRPLRAQVCAHLAGLCARQGDRTQARRWARAVVHNRDYPLTPREAAILGERTYRARPERGRRPALPAAPSVAPSVNIRFFGSPVLTIAGQPLGSSWWARSKGRELLWYALAHGAAGFTRAEACADLFPESDGVAASRTLRNVLYELRRLLHARCGVEALHTGLDGRLRLQPSDLSPTWETDTRQLQQWLAHLRAGAVEQVGHLPALLAGGYLADLHADWTRPFRQYWEQEAIYALDLCAAHYERAGQAAEAVACLRREVEFCPDDAAVIRRLMLLYQALGDSGGLRATYHAHRRALREELGVEPEADLVRLYERLTHA